MARKRHLHQPQGVYFGFCFYCGYCDRYSVSNLWIIFFPHSESILFAALGGSGRAGHRRRNSVRTLAARQYSTGCSPLCRTNPFQHRVTNMYRCLQWFHRTATLFPQLLYEQTDFFEARLVTICLEIF